MNLSLILEQAGLNHHESQIYLLLLELGSQPASQLAKKTKTARSTIRSVLDKLCEKGVVSKTYKGNTQKYFCEPPTKILDFLQKKIHQDQQSLEKVRESIPLLSSLWGQKSFVPKVKFYEGEEGIIEAFNHSLYQEGVEEILFLTAYGFISSPKLKKNDLDFYIPMRLKRGMGMRVLSEKNPEAIAFLKSAPDSLREHRFVPEAFIFPGNVHIYGDYVAFFSTKKEEFAVLIESHVIVETMRQFFEFMWSKAEL